MPPLPPAPKAVRVVSEWRGPLNPPPKKKRTERYEAKQDESMPPLPPAPKAFRVVSEWRGPLDPPPPKKKRTESREAKPEESIPPPIVVASEWSGPRPLYNENGELAHPESDGSKLTRLVLSPITSLRRLIKFVSRFLSRNASGTVGSK